MHFKKTPPQSLQPILTGRVCIIGIGNRDRGDDAAGPCVIDQRTAEADGWWIDVGSTPENYVEIVARFHPDTILLIDAVDLGAAPGEWAIVQTDELDSVAISTHAGSLSMIADYLIARTGARIWLLGIQPQQVEFGEALSPPVAAAIPRIANHLSAALNSKPKRERGSPSGTALAAGVKLNRQQRRTGG